MINGHPAYKGLSITQDKFAPWLDCLQRKYNDNSLYLSKLREWPLTHTGLLAVNKETLKKFSSIPDVAYLRAIDSVIDQLREPSFTVERGRNYYSILKTKAKASRFAADVLRDDDLADSLEDESPESYAERKGIVITDNPSRRNIVANDDMSKSELQDCVDQALDILQGAYVPESDRETLAQAVGDAIAALEGDEDDDGDGADDDDTR